MKTCFKCGQEKPLSAFYRHPQMADGHLNKCADCIKADRRLHEREHPDKVLESRIKQCAKKPTHKNAYKCVEMAVKSGVMDKPHVCSICGRPDTEKRIEAHHHDYTKPLDVIWLCSVCHDKADQLKREYEGGRVSAVAKSVVMKLHGKALCCFDSIVDAARSVGCAPSSISMCLAGKTRTCKGLEWEYGKQ